MSDARQKTNNNNTSEEQTIAKKRQKTRINKSKGRNKCKTKK
jgi:hypothetical protein